MLYDKGGIKLKKILCAFLILIFLANVGQAQIAIDNEKNSNRGGFEAEIGIIGSEEASIFLDGDFGMRWRYIVVNGIATNGEEEIRFQGFFRGSFFILQIPIRGRIVNIFGRCAIGEDNNFRGAWRARGTRITGWIEGSFTR